MKFRCLTTILFPAACLAAFSETPAADRTQTGPIWQTNLRTAFKQSRKEGRPLLIHFYATWCDPCIRMDRETFSAAEFRKQVSGRFIVVKINTDRHPELVRQYGIHGLPSDVFVSPNGRILSRSTGYLSKRRYLSQLARWDSRFVKRSKVQIARAKPNPQQVKIPSKKQVATKPNVQPPGKVLIGLDGYSPVAMHQQRKWIPGKVRFAWRHHGISYWMADENELAAFRRNPRQYAPRLLGCDPVVLQETDRAVPGKIRYGAIFDGELFFYTSAASRSRFRKTPLRYTWTRHVLRVDDINGAVLR